jgi:hypothetical protein
MPAGAGRISRIAGDFDGYHARDQLVAYAELNVAGQPSRWHVRVVLATGHVADLALDNTGDWIGPNGLVARRAVDANGDGRDEGFVTSTGGASNDAYNLFGLADCQLRQVRVAANGPLQVLVDASVGHAEGFDCQSADGCSPSGASSGPTSSPTAAPPTPTPRPATAGPATRWCVRWTPTTAGSPPSRMVYPG